MNTHPNRLPRLFTVDETAVVLRTCTKTVRRLIAAGKLPAHRVGNQLRTTEPDIGAYLAQTKR